MKLFLLRITPAVVLAMLLAGCTTQEISRNIYEGARAHAESSRSTPRSQPYGPLPSFDDYDRERRILATPHGD